MLFAFRRAQVLTAPAGKENERWQRVSGHLAAAIRLRRTQPKAVAPIRSAAIRSAASAIDRARTRRIRTRDEALELWPALQAGRFSLVPGDRSGAGYCPVENAPSGPSLGLLSSREQAAVALLSLGRSNKAIAYELGVVPSTASTFLANAARKLGVAGASGLIAVARATVHATARVQGIAQRANLTEAETVVLGCLMTGLGDSAIAELRGATRSTVTKQVDAVFRKLGVGSRRELLAGASSVAPWNGGEGSGTSAGGGSAHDLSRRVP